MLTAPPPCPSWCRSHDDEGAWWDVHPAATTSVCRVATVVADDGGFRMEIAVERFAAQYDGTVHIEPPMIRVNGGDAMSFSAALAASDALRELIAKTGGTVLAA